MRAAVTPGRQARLQCAQLYQRTPERYTRFSEYIYVRACRGWIESARATNTALKFRRGNERWRAKLISNLCARAPNTCIHAYMYVPRRTLGQSVYACSAGCIYAHVGARPQTWNIATSSAYTSPLRTRRAALMHLVELCTYCVYVRPILPLSPSLDRRGIVSLTRASLTRPLYCIPCLIRIGFLPRARRRRLPSKSSDAQMWISSFDYPAYRARARLVIT